MISSCVSVWSWLFERFSRTTLFDCQSTAIGVIVTQRPTLVVLYLCLLSAGFLSSRAAAQAPPALEAAPSWRTEKAQFCTDLKQAINSARDGFESAKGRNVRSDVWMSRSTLAGTSDCSIKKLTTGTVYYSCRALTTKTPQDLRAAFVELSKDVRGCLGREWQGYVRKPNEALVSIILEHPVIAPTVELRERTMLDELELLIEINVRDTKK